MKKFRVAFEPHLDSINEAFYKYFKEKQDAFDFHNLNKPTWKSEERFKIIKMLWFIIKSFFAFIKEYDLVHINAANFGIVAYFASFFGCKYIYTIHGCPYIDIQKNEGYKIYILSTLNAYCMKFVVKRARKVFTISEFCRNELLEKYGINSNVIYNGYDYSIFHKKKLFNNKLQIALNNKNPIIISVGRMVDCKNPIRIIDIFKKILSNHSDAHLIFIGDGILRNKVVKYITLHNLQSNITFLPKVPYIDMPYYYSISDYFISGCDIEGFGLATIEAVGCECIPIVPYAGAFLEIFKDKHFFYDANTLSDFNLPDDNIKEKLKLELLQIQNIFQWTESLKKYEQEYLQLLN